MSTMILSLPDDLRAFVEGQVATGQFIDAGEYLRDIIRERQAAVDRLRALIEEGDASGDSGMTVEDVIARARERFESSAR